MRCCPLSGADLTHRLFAEEAGRRAAGAHRAMCRRCWQCSRPRAWATACTTSARPHRHMHLQLPAAARISPPGGRSCAARGAKARIGCACCATIRPVRAGGICRRSWMKRIPGNRGAAHLRPAAGYRRAVSARRRAAAQWRCCASRASTARWKWPRCWIARLRSRMTST